MSGLGLRNLPECIGNLVQLEILEMGSNRLTALPESIGNLVWLKNLNVHNNQLTALPESIGSLVRLIRLNVGNNQLMALPESIGNLVQLRGLDASSNQLRALPESIGNLLQLKQLELGNNRLTALPESIGNLGQLMNLSAYSNHLRALPESIGNLVGLIFLSVSLNRLTALPESIGNLRQLESLRVDVNHLTALPESVGSLGQLTTLSLYSNRLTELPESIGNLVRLTSLDMHTNQLTALPESIGNLVELTSLDVHLNRLTALPESIGNLVRLTRLDAKRNQLTALPESIGNLVRLTSLNVNHNQLTALPGPILQLPASTTIDLERNPLTQQVIMDLSQRLDGPRIQFSIHEPPAARWQGAQMAPSRQRGTDFESVIRRYRGEIGSEELGNLAGTENADSFRQLLLRLNDTAEARFPGFADRVAAVVGTLAEASHAELRANCFLQAREGLATCSDRVAITFGDIEMACKVQRIVQAGGGDAPMAQLLKGLFRLNELDIFARNDIAGRRGVDEIEVLLAYRVGLKEELALPCESGAMLYAAISGVDRGKLDRAKAHVLTAESADNGRALVEFAIEQPFWNTHVQSDPFYQQKKESLDAVFQTSSEELEERGDRGDMGEQDYVREYNELAANRESALRDLLRECTHRILDHGSDRLPPPA